MRFIEALTKIGIVGICKTIIFNFRYMPFSQAVHIPVLISSKVKVVKMGRNRIVLDGLGGASLAF